MAISIKLKRKIIKLYHTLAYPGSFGGLKTFKQSLKDNSNIDISEKELRKIMYSSELYATSVKRPQNFLTRKIVAEGGNIEATADVGYLKAKTRMHHILVVVDIFTKMVHATLLRTLQGESIRKAMKQLFPDKFPFSILRTDNDTAFNKIRPFFNKEKVLLIFKNTRAKSAIAERMIRTVKNKMYGELRTNPEANVRNALKKAVDSINQTPLLKTGLTPFEMQNPLLEPKIRSALNPKQTSVKSFSELFHFDKKWRKVFHKPPSKNQAVLLEQKVLPKGTVVYVNHRKGRWVRYYDVSRGRLYQVERIDMTEKNPDLFLYKLIDFKNEEVPGYFARRELVPASVNIETFLKREVDKIKRHRTIKGKRYDYVTFKDYDKSFDQWVSHEDLVRAQQLN